MKKKYVANSKYSIPYNGDINNTIEILNSNLSNYVSEIYFAGNPIYIPSGRRPKVKYHIVNNSGAFKFDYIKYDEDLELLITICKNIKINSNLLLNFFGNLTKSNINYIGKLIELGVNIVTIGDTTMLPVIKKQFGYKVKIQNSIFIKINSSRDYIDFQNNGMQIILVHPDYNHSHSILNDICNHVLNRDIEFKIMLNEGCLIECPFRTNEQLTAQVYSIKDSINDFVNNPNEIRPLTQSCRKILNEEGMSISNFIHPNNLTHYDEYGFTYKIVGRSFSSINIVKTLKAYIKGDFQGDFRSIVENFKHSYSPVNRQNSFRTNFIIGE
ncbi:MAG: hypothetical protein K8S23_01235 [Candidatus Cloacimonetes bacterium]|nr:hypothetical protein [Candidatus Cloacimonadota bacterium]